MAVKSALINYTRNCINDNLYTPFYAIEPLLKYFSKPPLKVWECCDFGKSNITKILKDNGYEVISTDIVSGFNFLKDTPNFKFDMIITNPPFSLKMSF